MDKKQQEFLKRLRETFRVEADEHVRAISGGILKLESGLSPDEQAAKVELIFREAHSLKGAARAVNLLDIESVCQSLESVFSALKRGNIQLSRLLYDRFHSAISLIEGLIATDGGETSAKEKARVVQVVRELGESARGVTPSGPQQAAVGQVAQDEATVLNRDTILASKPLELEPPEVTPTKPAAQPPTTPESARKEAEVAAEKDLVRLPETVRISTAKLNAILMQAEEMLSAKLTLGQRVLELRELAGQLGPLERERVKIQPEVRLVLRGLEKQHQEEERTGHPERRGTPTVAVAKLAAFTQSADVSMKSLQSKILSLAKSAEQDCRAVSTMVDRLLEDTRKALMLPFTFFLEAIPKLVRDLARDSGKDVGLVIQGGEIEVDRRILEEMKDPLVHLVRNCIDHGIEKPEQRKRQNKPPQGVITVSISQRDGGKVEILVSDDGAGINLTQVRASSMKAGAVSPEDAAKMDDAAAAALIFHSGVSTSPFVTDLSGRGLGLAIVREKVDKLGGNISLETRPNIGTAFRMVLPLSLASFRGVLVRSEEQMFIVPSVQVVHTLRVKRERIKSVENRETLEHEGSVIPLVRLGDVLGLPSKTTRGDDAAPLYLLVLTSAEQRMAFVVDEILEEQEVLVKSLGRNIARVRNISGAAVLGSGKVVPVLNVTDLMQSALTVVPATRKRDESAKQEQERRRRLLVAEDSITTRTLLRNILESAGYSVKTAMDGVDALTSLRAEDFDLVVSDVDMPRMNGFGLAAAIRADKRLAGLPIVLVTALESREDRERGMDIGANAYLVKSSFEQSNLLEVVRRLI